MHPPPPLHPTALSPQNTKCGTVALKVFLEIKDTHRPKGGPVLLGIVLPEGPMAVRVLNYEELLYARATYSGTGHTPLESSEDSAQVGAIGLALEPLQPREAPAWAASA